MDYKEAGVDIEKTDSFIENIKDLVKSTYNKNVIGHIGGFAGMYDIGGDKALVASTDGVGTKLLLAQNLNIHNTIGIDLVAMCVNDLICLGATPLFFLDYFATGKFTGDIGEEIVKGIVAGCKQSKIPLLGGETAEMPGMYSNDEYDLAGFSIGIIDKNKIIDGKKINDGCTLLGVSSSGFHSNGYSLVRKLIKDDDPRFLQDLLTPTYIYTEFLSSALEKFPEGIKGIANITGGGLWNVPRINNHFDFYFDNLPGFSEIPSVFKIICDRANLEKEELYKTFNMGIGLVLVVDGDQESEILNYANDFYKTWKIGTVRHGSGNVILGN